MAKSNLFAPSALISTSCCVRSLYSGGIRSTETMLAPPGPPASSSLAGVLPSPDVIMTRYLPGFNPDLRSIEYWPLVMSAPEALPRPSNGSNVIVPVSSGAPSRVTDPVTPTRPSYLSPQPERTATPTARAHQHQDRM